MRRRKRIAFDDFDYRNGRLPAPWIDLADTWGRTSDAGDPRPGFDPAGVNDGTFGVRGNRRAVGHLPQPQSCEYAVPNAEWAAPLHIGAYQELPGVTDGVEVSAVWETPRNAPSLDELHGEGSGALTVAHLHQVGPATHVRGTARPRKRLGLTNWWDVSVSGAGPLFGCHAIFRTYAHREFDLGPKGFPYDVFDWNVYAGGTSAQWLAARRHEVSMRVFDDRVEGLCDGSRVWGPVEVPAWARGRDGWGITAMDITDTAVGRPWRPQDFHAQVSSWTVRPWTEPLGEYPAPVDVDAGPLVTRRGAGELAVEPPAGVRAGDLLLIAVAVTDPPDSGQIVRPPRWYGKHPYGTVRRDRNPSIELTMLRAAERAGGPRRAPVPVVVTGGRAAAAVMLRLRGTNPNADAVLDAPALARATMSGLGTSPKAHRPVALGPNRRGIWLVAAGAATRVEPPRGYTGINRQNVRGRPVNIAVAVRVPSFEVFNPRCGPPHVARGTLAAPAPWIATAGAYHPDPR